MTEQFFLKKDDSIIRYKVDLEVNKGNASTIPRLKRMGGSIKNLDPSPDTKNGSIPKRELGKSNDLADATLVFDTAVLIDGVPASELDAIFNSLKIVYTLFGGLDGDQVFELGMKEKLQFMDKKLIVASKAIKLVTQ